jgi:beta-lactamase class A
MNIRHLIVFFVSVLFTASLPASVDLGAGFEKLEKKIGGRLGVAAIDTKTGQQIINRGDESFLMCSTFKLLLGGHILKRADNGQETLGRSIKYSEKDLLDYAPVTRKNVDKGSMTVADLNAAAIQWSDNSAANLLLVASEGPRGLTKYVRSLGDEKTRLDRIEPFLNSPEEGKNLDTTTPVAMAKTIQRLVLGSALSVPSREQLNTWLLESQTGAKRLKAGVPTGWKVASKTGTCASGTMGDVGILYPPSGAPVVIATYISEANAKAPENEAALAEVARIVSEQFSKTQ